MSLLLPNHVARDVARKRVMRNLEEVPQPAKIDERHQGIVQAIEKSIGDDVVESVDTPIPDGLPDPGLWRVALMPVRQIARTKSGLIMVPEFLDVQNWTHQLWKIAKVGPLVYRSPTYRACASDEELDALRPQVGELWLSDPKAPRRYKYKGITIIVVNDDQLWSKVDPDKIDGLEFKMGLL